MYANDWNRAAVVYGDWALRNGYPIPEDMFTPPLHRASPPAPPPPPPPPKKSRRVNCVKCRKVPASLLPFHQGMCKPCAIRQNTEAKIRAGVMRRAMKRKALDERAVVM